MTEKGNNFTDLVTVGRITTAYGVRGWVKVHSYTEPMDNILQFPNWRLRGPKGWETYQIDAGRHHGKGLVVHIKGIDSRDEATQFCQCDIAVVRGLMPVLEPGEYYWHQLEGLRVVSHFQGEVYDFGNVAHMMQTGANDVLVVRGGADRRERLIPYLPGQFVLEIDLQAGVITVDWDPAF
ncbi:ribosome maturation factor RimM [Microbulbifer sp. 2205BS26-8]|uniref:ribosome maturation factor RimM n=1 Tax=Microbulbifer sp. 2205BS26-8 TaxID=3064386 RepID=UPI00273E363D|nr:ribosome maturation factor RimM [Microbulbifer sp. 2205BS26-8]MDP5211087.1 ribosome maturation factor RimM [Microbulbifer sp. 2205BS26-8]